MVDFTIFRLQKTGSTMDSSNVLHYQTYLFAHRDVTWGPRRNGVLTLAQIFRDDPATGRPLTGSTPLADGSLIVTSSFDSFSRPVFLVAKLNEQGEVDDTFGVDGRVTGTFLPGINAYGGPITEDKKHGRLLMAGSTWTATYANPLPAILCLDQTGKRVADFGSDGQLIVDLSSEQRHPVDTPVWVCSQSDGSFFVGVDYVVGPLRVLTATLLKFDEFGQPAADFGKKGRIEVRLVDTTTATSLNDCCILDDGRILIAGYAQAPGETKKALLAMLNANGSTHLQFGDRQTPGVMLVSPEPLDAAFNAVKQRTANTFVAGGYSDKNDEFLRSGLLMGFDTSGRLDDEFNAGRLLISNRDKGRIPVNWEDLVFLDGHILAAGGNLEGSYIGCINTTGYLEGDFVPTGSGFLDETPTALGAPSLHYNARNRQLYCGVNLNPRSDLGGLYRYQIHY
ncbi:hypothetical protein JRG42_13355 [Pseudomonas granadensis]|uniref:Delta-60 repeat domain-containing protein n=1 Tax=Pseudomonas granadensis TaxID=1421430 RepID=A0ABX7GIN7_9PSED|nr:hypothetical protein [Pseudomonas granadensis]MBN6774723.1 hypothetical protein [Pseudomonas granadensis]MBN6805477.1 hypothetical protein [Pseudomonas granadensis]MBN6832749.1 hypothetical protein [Pseudomonas granadensis]MBN6839671.1 hypothetical protein [Pseudomonas granadensis]MBN6869046.1 hypothetical protein [Pseudomonas granadensis]